MATRQPNILIILTDQLRQPTVYETDELRRFRRESLTAETVCGTREFRWIVTTLCGPHALRAVRPL